MRARLALAVSHQTCELREVVLSRKPAELHQASAKATVPVLVDTDGRVLEESLDIMLWALQRHDPLQWLPEPEHLADVMHWIKRCDDEFKPQLDRYKYPTRFELADRSEPRNAVARFLADLQQRLTETTCLSGTQWGLADAAIGPFVRQCAHTDSAWFASQPWPNLQNWLADFEASALFQIVMVKHPPWQPGQPQTLVFEP
ncbi:glutathione S-transferase [Rhodoferax sp.]|uniref:glutathione S-transferase n=1 Tax=Rhodoferax sp. TaxID=50421 RepID=UPI0025CBE070|nr:glutathione S-transferase [Rhodoferax sp.]MCM2297002.1 glutathione S-transferase [Rhodoferax sp.]